MTNPIVTVNVAEVIAAAPSKLQKSGALVSLGGTAAAAGSYTFLTQESDLDTVAAATITTITWAGNVATVTTAAPHGFPAASEVEVTIAGQTPAGYNGQFLATRTGASTFTYALTPDPGAQTVAGTYRPTSAIELDAMAGTFFAQGAAQGVWVLELGIQSYDDGVDALDDWITANDGVFYAYCVPAGFADEAAYLTFVAQFEANTSKTYFFTTVDSGNYTDFTAVMKSVFAVIQAPLAPATEWDAAADMRIILNYNPSSTNKVTPTAFTYLLNVTEYPQAGNSALLNTYKEASVNYVGNGGEGGISNKILLWGTTKDGHDFTYWYSVDWMQIEQDRAIANAVINGSNNPTNPLYFNQDGIDRLQAVAARVATNGVSYGLVLGTVLSVQLSSEEFTDNLSAGVYDGVTVINAVPFLQYNTENPNDYAVGQYSGLTIAYVPARGFKHIIFNILVSQFVTGQA